jgi:hypothetical protein
VKHLFIIIILIFGYIRVKFGFWALQPVFHVYNLSYMIWPPGIINHELPEKETTQAQGHLSFVVCGVLVWEYL